MWVGPWFINVFLGSNGQSVEGADHQYVVQCIRQSGKQVTLDIVPVSEEEARRLEPDSSASSNALEYYERRSVPVSVSSSEKKADDNGKDYVVSSSSMFHYRTMSGRISTPSYSSP